MAIKYILAIFISLDIDPIDYKDISSMMESRCGTQYQKIFKKTFRKPVEETTEEYLLSRY